MRPQALLFLLFTLSAVPARAQSNDSAPLTCAQFLAWTAGGMSSHRLIRLAHQGGLAFPLDASTSNSLLEAGVEPALLQSLRTVAPGGREGSDCPASLVGASELVQEKKYREAQSVLQKQIAASASIPPMPKRTASLALACTPTESILRPSMPSSSHWPASPTMPTSTTTWA